MVQSIWYTVSGDIVLQKTVACIGLVVSVDVSSEMEGEEY